MARGGTLGRIDTPGDLRLGWTDALTSAVEQLRITAGDLARPGRVMRLDRGWSTILQEYGGQPMRVRNVGADVAAGDWVIPSLDDEKVDHVLPRHSAFTRRASFEGNRAESHTIAANIDTVMLLHALTSPPNQRRLERELVLAFDSGAVPVVVLTKTDLVDDVDGPVAMLTEVASGVRVLTASGITGEGVDALRSYAAGHATVALLGSSGVGKSTLVNAIVRSEVQRTAVVRDGDQRGRHTTVAAELVEVPGAGWLIDTPGVRAVSLWSSGTGIERAFADVFALGEQCRFRNCKHEDEPGCAVQAAIAEETLDPRRLDAMKRLVAEEAALEEEQRAREKATDRRGYRKQRPH